MTSKVGYWIGAGLVTFGILGALAWGVVAYWHADGVIDGFERVPVPGEGEVRLQAREYVVYVEGPRRDEIAPGVRVRITDPRTGKALKLSEYGGRLTSDSFDRTGVARKRVTVAVAGTYTLRTGGADRTRRYMVALGDSVEGLNHVTVYGTLAIGAFFGLSGVGLLITTGLRRRRGALVH